jgi:hypothetical protein
MNQKTQAVADRLGDDILPNVPAISDYLNETEGETRWHIRKGHYDAAIYRVGKLIKGRKSEFRKLLSPSKTAA